MWRWCFHQMSPLQSEQRFRSATITREARKQNTADSNNSLLLLADIALGNYPVTDKVDYVTRFVHATAST